MNSKLQKSNNTIQALWIVMGSIMTFVFSIASTMILSRYFNKIEYGTYRQIMYIYLTLFGLFSLGLPQVYTFFLPRLNISAAKLLINRMNVLLLGLGFALSIIIFFGAETISIILNNQNLVVSLKWFSLVPLFMLPTIGIEGILSTYKLADLLAFYNIFSRLLMLLFVTAPVLFFHGSIKESLIGFTISSCIIFIFSLLLQYYPVRKVKSSSLNSVSYREIFRYIKPIILSSLFGILIGSTDQYFVSRYFGAEVFAEFANGTLELPFVTMIVSASSLILSPIFSKIIYEGTKGYQSIIIQLWISAFSKSIKLIYPLVVFFFCFADEIMILAYGGNYENSGLFFQIKLIVNFFSIAMYGSLIFAIGGNKFYFRVHMFGAIILIFAQWLFVKIFNSPFSIIIVSVICQIGRISILFLYIANYLNVKVHKLFPTSLLFEVLLPCFVFMYTSRLIFENYFNFERYNLLFYSAFAYGLLFSIWVYYRKVDYLSIVRPLFSKNKE